MIANINCICDETCVCMKMLNFGRFKKKSLLLLSKFITKPSLCLIEDDTQNYQFQWKESYNEDPEQHWDDYKEFQKCVMTIILPFSSCSYEKIRYKKLSIVRKYNLNMAVEDLYEKKYKESNAWSLEFDLKYYPLRIRRIKDYDEYLSYKKDDDCCYECEKRENLILDELDERNNYGMIEIEKY